jgi:HPr kinase/phosphorylase
MPDTITIESVFTRHQRRLRLEWQAGKSGAQKTLTYTPENKDEDIRFSIVGHLNLIQKHLIQVIGKKEHKYLSNLDASIRNEILNQLFSGTAITVIVANALEVSDELKQLADDSSVPLFSSSVDSHELIDYMQYVLSAQLAERRSMHGVFMEVMGIGVLLIGDSAIGKSELALELINRGHRLIADDAPEFSVVSPDTISGRSPYLLQDILEVRGLGILNIRAMFGDNAIKRSKFLRLVVNLARMSDSQIINMDRLSYNKSAMTILNIEVPMVTLPVASGRNLAVMVEAAVRNHLLLIEGFDSTKEFITRQRKEIEKSDK